MEYNIAKMNSTLTIYIWYDKVCVIKNSKNMSIKMFIEICVFYFNRNMSSHNYSRIAQKRANSDFHCCPKLDIISSFHQ